MKIAFYHVHLTDDSSWSYIFLDQIKEALNSGLLDNLDELNICANGNDEEISKAIELFNHLQTVVKAKIVTHFFHKQNKDTDFFSVKKSITEDDTLKLLWERCKNETQNFHVLYFHTKGSTAIWRYLNNKKARDFFNYYFWRKQGDWAVLENYKICNDKLNDYDAVGTNLSLWPLPHFSGGFWWANSSFIKTLPDPSETYWWYDEAKNTPALNNIEERVKAELWLGIGKARFFSLYHNNQQVLPNKLPNEVYYDRKEYEAYLQKMLNIVDN